MSSSIPPATLDKLPSWFTSTSRPETNLHPRPHPPLGSIALGPRSPRPLSRFCGVWRVSAPRASRSKGAPATSVDRRRGCSGSSSCPADGCSQRGDVALERLPVQTCRRAVRLRTHRSLARPRTPLLRAPRGGLLGQRCLAERPRDDEPPLRTRLHPAALHG